MTGETPQNGWPFGSGRKTPRKKAFKSTRRIFLCVSIFMAIFGLMCIVSPSMMSARFGHRAFLASSTEAAVDRIMTSPHNHASILYEIQELMRMQNDFMMKFLGPANNAVALGLFISALIVHVIAKTYGGGAAFHIFGLWVISAAVRLWWLAKSMQNKKNKKKKSGDVDGAAALDKSPEKFMGAAFNRLVDHGDVDQHDD